MYAVPGRSDQQMDISGQQQPPTEALHEKIADELKPYIKLYDGNEALQREALQDIFTRT